MWRFIRYSLRLRRVEYRLAELPIFLIPMLLTIDDAAAFLSPAFWEGLLVFFFLFAFGDLLNCLADRDLDAIYKPHLTEAVYGLGIRGVIVQAVISALAAVALATHLAWLLDRWLLLVAVIAGLFLAYAYSVEPIRLKGRGLGQLVFYWTGLLTGPMIFSALLFSAQPSWEVLCVAFTYGMVQTGVILVNTAEDYPEDRQMGVSTVIVALGLKPGIALATMLTVLGSLGILSVFAVMCRQRNVAPWQWALVLPLVVACVTVSICLGGLQRRISALTEENAIGVVKRFAAWVPVWMSSVALTSLLAAVMLFFQAAQSK